MSFDKDRLINEEKQLKQFAIRNSQFAITFCDGDLDPTQNALLDRSRGLKPPPFVKSLESKLYFYNK